MTCDMSMVFSGYASFIHQFNWLPRYNWNIIESGVKHHKLNQTTLNTYVTCRFSYNFIYWSQVFQIKVTFISYIFLKYMYFKADFVSLYDFIMFRIFVNIVLRGQMSWPIVHFERFHVYITMLHVKGRLFLCWESLHYLLLIVKILVFCYVVAFLGINSIKPHGICSMIKT